MTKEFWFNLPVKDVQKSKAFFTRIGFAPNPRFGDSYNQASLYIGEKQVVLMLFPEAAFKQFTGTEIPDLTNGSQVLFSIDAQSKGEVDELLEKVVEAGGTIFSKPKDQGWMYGAGFADLDGHRWNVLYMDASKMPAP